VVNTAKEAIKGILPVRGKAARHAGHVGLGDAHLKKTVGIGLLKQSAHGGLAQVGLQHNDVGVLFAQGHQCISICLS